ncbi:MAG: hypothetical protein EOP52_06300 [Sphingobacteriales bacterium]|nr:MAG: hypothetical protein EOP52_06300 [Sphingobacteriales bacterium]
MGFRVLAVWILCCCLGGLLSGCANILPPSGGPKDTLAPRLLSILPADSGTGIRPKKIELRFDEYIVLRDVATQLQLSPLLAQNPTAESDLRRVVITLPDTLLQPNTTYRLSLGAAIRDLHEENPFPPFTYTFSTGSYFDSLRFSGRVMDAATGTPDTAVQVVLYEAAQSTDSSILTRKPMYVARTDAAGRFRFDGLPDRTFRVFALGDKNTNLIFDGAAERIGFTSQTYQATTSDTTRLTLYSFVETDTASRKDSTSAPPAAGGGDKAETDARQKEDLRYTVGVDTGNLQRRTGPLTEPLKIQLNERIGTVQPTRIFLSLDSAGITLETQVRATPDSANSKILLLSTDWKPNTVYTLRLQKGFVQDIRKRDAEPGKWIFRTKTDEDYASMDIHLPARYRGSNYVLQVLQDGTTRIYSAPVTDTSIRLRRLLPATYTLRILDDRNRNGIWDAGNLLLGQQPERVYPLDHTIQLKAGWENVVDWKDAE